jgi:predicted  nucleic acid-binding Zn-ribbon protein
MEPTDLTLEVLKGIRQELHDTRDALRQELHDTRDALGTRLDTVAEEVHGMREELSRRIVESEIRTSTAITDLAGTVREMTSVLRAANDLRPRVERCEHDIADIKRRVG